MTAASRAPPSRWDDALMAASLLAVDPEGLAGVHVRARAGAVRDRWLEVATGLVRSGAPVRRMSAGIPLSRLVGGLDIGRTVDRGRPVVELGVLAAADGGMLVVSMAERLDPAAAAVIGAAMDDRQIRIERDGISARQPARFVVLALDEGIDDECLAASLSDRTGLLIDLGMISLRESGGGQVSAPAIEAARALLPSLTIDDDLVEALCAVAASAGVGSMRACQHLVRAARAAAALRGSACVEVEDAATALRLVLGIQASAPEDAAEDAPATPATATKPQPEGETDRQEELSADALRDLVLQAVAAVLPKHLLAGLAAGSQSAPRQGTSGKAGAMRSRARRGRVVGSSSRPPAPGARLDVLATLRQAAPWQRLRVGGAAGTDLSGIRRLRIRKCDFRYARYREKTGTTAIFAVDASGSAAVQRLAETKGAIELLLGECYVRRDQVALIAFRGANSETLLEPTRSLVRAKRCLSALPGGGGTPLASGILASLAMAEGSVRKGQSVVAVFLTDGRGNVGLDGGTAKAQVAADVDRAACSFRMAGIRSIVIDTGQRPQARARSLADSLGAEYLALPRGGATAVAREIAARMEG